MTRKLRLLSAVLLIVVITLLATGSAFAAEAADLDQCRNGSFASPVTCGTGWANGNINSTQGHYREGDSVPFRMVMTGLTVGNTNTLVIEYDYTAGTKHSYDYLTTYNRTETTANPCFGITPCASPSTFPIPTLGVLASAVPPVSQIAGDFTIWNGSISAVSYIAPTTVTAEGSNLVVRVSITFTSTNATSVIAWGGHIASSLDWGVGDSAAGISGSSYHMRLIDLNGSGGNQDRSIQASAVPVPATIATQVSSSSITIGQSVTDLATVTGQAPVTGTVTFFVCGPNGSPTACTSDGTQVGSAVNLAPGTGTSGTATSASFTPTQLGSYCFRAEYTPGATSPNSANTHTNATTECVTVNPPNISISTVPNPTTADEGDTLNDTAILADGVNPTGTITFNLYPPSNATCTGDPLYTQTVPVSGNGNYVTTPGFTATVPGTWRWVAVYSGDGINPSVSGGCDDEMVTVNNLPSSIEVVKTANPTTIAEPGGTVTFSVSITNTSAYDVVTINSITDDIYGNVTTIVGSTCTVPQVLNPGDPAYTCSFPGEVSGAAGSTHTDVVTASGVDDDGVNVTDDDNATVTITDVASSIEVDKTANPTTVNEPGGTVTFTVVVTNTSAVDTVTVDSLIDSVFGNLTDGGNTAISGSTCVTGAVLAPGEDYTCTFDAEIEGNAGFVHHNVVTGTAIDDDDNEVSDTDDADVTITNVNPTVDIVKDVDPSVRAEPGGPFQFTLTITNTSDEDVQITSLTDDNLLSQQCLDLVGTWLTPGQFVSCNYTVTHTDAGVYPNTAVVEVVDDEGNEASDSDNESVEVTNTPPTVTIVKTAEPTSLAEPGGEFTFTLTITNTSDENVIITQLDDSNGLSTECLALVGMTLIPDQVVTCDNTNTHTDTGDYFNEASVTVIDNEGSEASDDDNETVTVTDVVGSITVVKTANPTNINEPGGTVTFSVSVTNNSTFDTVTINSLVDNIYGDVTAASNSTCVLPQELGPGEDYNCTFEGEVTGEAGSIHTDVVTGTGVDDDGVELTDDDDAVVTIVDVAGSITVDKTANPTSVNEPGGTVTFTVVVTNNSTLDSMSLNSLVDDIYGDLTLADNTTCVLPQNLAPNGGFYSCSFTGEVSGNAGSIHTDVVTGTAVDDDDVQHIDDDDAVVTIADVVGSITVDKTANPTSVNEPGGTVTFNVTVTNNSTLDTMSLNSLVDDVYGDVTAASNSTCILPQSIAPGGNYSCSFEGAVNGDAGTSHTDIVTGTAVDDDGVQHTDDDDAVVTIEDVAGTITVTKTASPFELPEPGGTVTFTVSVRNNSTFDTFTLNSLTDDQFGDLDGQGTCSVPQSIAPGDTYTCSFDGQVTGNAGFVHTNVVTGSGVDDDGVELSDDDDATVTITDLAGSITVTKTADPETVSEPGGTVTFNVDVHNNSDVDTITLTSLTDDVYGDLDGQGTCSVPQTILPGASYTCSFEGEVTGDAGTSHTDVVTASGVDDDQQPVSDADDATVTITDVASTITVIKTANPTSVNEPGGSVTFSVSVHNDSLIDIFFLNSLTDSVYGDLDGQGTCNVPQVLAPNTSYNCSFTKTVSGDANTTHTNVVTGSGVDDDNVELSDSDDAVVNINDVLPTVTIDKSVVPDTRTEPGGDFIYTLTITNTSIETVTITALTDSYALPADCTDLIGTTLAPGASTSCTYTLTYTDTGSFSNTAVVEVEDNEGNKATDDDTVTVTVTEAGVSVNIVKSVDVHSRPEPGGDFTFTLTITNTSVEAVTITSLIDTQSAAAADFSECDDLVGTSLAAGASTSCDYTVTHTAVGSYPNTATVVVEDNEGNEATDNDNETVTVTDILPTVNIVKSAAPSSLPAGGGVFTFTLTITNTSSEVVTITNLTDTYTLSAECLALIGTSLNPGQSVSCTYTVTQTASGSYTNTATVTVRDDEQNPATDSDNETVVVDPPTTPEECGFGFVLTGQIITGTPRSDFIQGTPGNDIIYGLNGHDEIFGNGGDDCIFGGRGLDNLFGNDGNDIIFGNEGDDYMDGGAGVDRMYGNEDDDLMLGGDDNDLMYGGTGSDCIFGQNGDDYIEGNDGDDAPLVGGNGNDIIYGGAGHDEMWGDGFPGDPGHPEFPVDVITNPGNDQLYGESGDDEMVGGGGNDTLVAGQGDDNMYGEDGDDTLTGNERSDFFDGGAGTGDTATDYLPGTDDLCINVEFGCGTPVAPIAPVVTDSDGDGVADGADVCAGSNDTVDTDADGTPDGCDSTPNGDDDSDGVDNAADICAGSDDATDTDGDLTPDGCDSTPNGDDDGDGVDNAADICAAGNDADDLDGDGTPDACDASDDRDLDGDTLTNTQEAALGTDPNLADTDGDGANDNVDTAPLDINQQ